MKATNWALAALIGFAALGGLSIAASTSANAWYCQARGTTGAWGWGAFLVYRAGQGRRPEPMLGPHAALRPLLHHVLPIGGSAPRA